MAKAYFKKEIGNKTFVEFLEITDLLNFEMD